MAGNGVNVGHGNISISPVLVPGFAGILQQQLNRARPQPTITINTQVNNRGLNSSINQTSQSANRLGTAFTGAFAALSARQLLTANNNISGLSNRLTALTAAATSAGGVLGSVVGLVGGLGAGLAVAGAGIGAFAALAAPQIKAVTTATGQVTKAQDAYNTAIATGDTAGAQKALVDRQKALAGLTPAQRQATLATLQLKDAFKQQSNALAPVTLGVYTKGLGILSRLLPALTPVAKAAGQALSDIATRAQAGLGQALSPDGGLGAFLNTVKSQIGPTLDKLAQVFVNLGNTISFVFQRAVPIMQPALDVIVHLTGALSNAAAGQGLIDFFAKVKPLLVPLQAAIQSVGGALGKFIQAALPLAGPVLNAVNALADALKGLFSSDQFQNFVTNIGSAITSLTPLFSALVGPIGNVLQTISQQFAALAPQLVPLVTQFAQVFSQVLVGLSPLLPLFVQLAGILVSFLPILYPIIVAFRDALAPILGAIGQLLIAIQPAVNGLVQAFVAILPPLGQVIGQLVTALAPVLAALLTALQPLIPALGQIAQALGQALLQVLIQIGPFLPQLVGAFVQLLLAVVPMIPALLQLATALLPLITPFLQLAVLILPPLAFVLRIVALVLTTVIGVFTWWVNLIRPAIPWMLAFISPFWLLVAVIRVLVGFWTWMWNTVIFPILKAAAPLFIWLYQNVILPAFDGIKAALSAVGAAFSWVWQNILQPVLNAFMAVARVVALVLIAFVFAPIKLAFLFLATEIGWVWNNILHPVFNAVAFVAGWLWNNILKPVFGFIADAWHKMSDGIKWAWDNVLHPALHAVAVVIGGVKDAFGAAVDGIKGIWNSLKKIFADPINIVIYPIVRNLAHAVDAVTDFAGLGRPLQGMEDLKDVHFRTGGVIPGNHDIDNVPFYGTPGEVVVPKPVVNAFGGPQALMSTLGFDGQGGGAGAHLFGGGPIHALTHNKLTDALGSAAGAVGGAAKKVGGFAFNAADWALDEVVGFVRAGAADALDGAYKAFSGPLFSLLGNGGVSKAMHGLVDHMEHDLIDAIRGKEQAPATGGNDGTSAPLIIQYGQKHGLPAGTVTTTGGHHAPGSFHYLGEAVDYGNAAFPNQRQVFDVFSAIAPNLLELFWDPAGRFWDNGRWNPGAIGGHGDHVHVAASVSGISQALGITPPQGSGSSAGESGGYNIGAEKAYAQSQLAGHGLNPGAFGLLDYIWTQESGWNPFARNSSGALGIPQALGHGNVFAPGDWRRQIDWGESYIKGRYGSLESAYAYKRRTGVYDQGGFLPPGLSLAMNATGRAEHKAVFTDEQWRGLSALASGVSGGARGPLVGTAYIREMADVDLLASQIDFKSRVGTL